jgi:hypothetical protein
MNIGKWLQKLIDKIRGKDRTKPPVVVVEPVEPAEPEAPAIPPMVGVRQDAVEAGRAYTDAGEKPVITIHRQNWGATLWKPANHSGNGIVMLLDPSWRRHYDAGEMGRVVIATDPWGRTVLRTGHIPAPYADGRPAIRFDGMDPLALRPGPVYVVLWFRDGYRSGVWRIDDPAVRMQ